MRKLLAVPPPTTVLIVINPLPSLWYRPGSEKLWRCRRPECGLDNETAVSKENCPKAAICVACNLPRGAEPLAVTEEDISYSVQSEAEKRNAAARLRKRPAEAAAATAGNGHVKLNKKQRAHAQKAARARRQAAEEADAVAKAKAAEGPWTCGVCTLVNSPALACEACGSARVLAQPSAMSEPATGNLKTRGSDEMEVNADERKLA